MYWFKSWQAAKQSAGILPLTENIYSPESPYNKNGLVHYLSTPEHVHQAGEALGEKARSYFKGNHILIEKFAGAYGFSYHVFYQPIGLLYPGHRFVKNQAEFDTTFYAVRQVNFLQKQLRYSIKSGEFKNCGDLSDEDRFCREPYVDLTHYLPELNLGLAKKIVQAISNKDTPGDK